MQFAVGQISLSLLLTAFHYWGQLQRQQQQQQQQQQQHQFTAAVVASDIPCKVSSAIGYIVLTVQLET